MKGTCVRTCCCHRSKPCLPASPRQLTVRTCTRHHSIPTPDEAGLNDLCTYLANTTYFSSSRPSISYLISSLPWLPRSRSAQCASASSLPQRQPPRRSHLIPPPTHQTRHRYRRKQALNSLSHHYQEQDPTACAFLPSPAAFDHIITTTATHRRSLSAVLTRNTACLLDTQPRDTQL